MRTVTAMAETLPARSRCGRRCGRPRRWSAGRAEPGHQPVNDATRDPPRADVGPVRVLIALDKFRGTATAHEAAAAVGHACWELGHDGDEAPMSDGGEGLLDVLGGANRTSIVTGPLGAPVEAAWRLDRRTAVIEMARASGLRLAGGADGNDPMRASTAGTGELIDRAIEQGARHVVVGPRRVGHDRRRAGRHRGAAQSRPGCAPSSSRSPATCGRRFLDAAAVFAPQKGATPAQVGAAHAPAWHRLAERYRHEYGVDVTELEGAGAAGGLAGGLAALGGRLRAGFDLVADHLELDDRIDGGRRRRHRRGLPRRAELRRQGGRRRLRAGAPGRPAGRRHRRRRRPGRGRRAAVGTASASCPLVERYGEHRARNEPRLVHRARRARGLAGAQPGWVMIAGGGTTVAPVAAAPGP